MVVKDKDLANDAQTALQNEDNLEQFKQDFKKDVLAKWIKNECDNDCMIKKLKRFIKTYKINGKKLGIEVYEATINGDNEITGWAAI